MTAESAAEHQHRKIKDAGKHRCYTDQQQNQTFLALAASSSL
jgi:hypothetical protein